jgi:hypothetical protein
MKEKGALAMVMVLYWKLAELTLIVNGWEPPFYLPLFLDSSSSFYLFLLVLHLLIPWENFLSLFLAPAGSREEHTEGQLRTVSTRRQHGHPRRELGASFLNITGQMTIKDKI